MDDNNIISFPFDPEDISEDLDSLRDEIFYNYINSELSDKLHDIATILYEAGYPIDTVEFQMKYDQAVQNIRQIIKDTIDGDNVFTLDLNT